MKRKIKKRTGIIISCLLVLFLAVSNLPIGDFAKVNAAANTSNNNIAIGKSVTASHSLSSTGDFYSVHHLTDGDMESSYGTGQLWGAVSWFYVDLEIQYDITNISFLWEDTAYATSYELYYCNENPSGNDGGWTKFYNQKSCQGGLDKISLSESIQARYIKIKNLTGNSEWGVTVYEFMVYGKISDSVALPTAQTPTVSVKKYTYNSIELEFNVADESKISGYKIIRNNVKDNPIIIEKGTNTYIDTNLTHNTRYYYNIYSYDENGDSLSADRITRKTAYYAQGETANINATVNAKKVLKYLASLTSNPNSGVVIGQFANHGKEVNSYDANRNSNDASNGFFRNSYDYLFDGLKEQTGKAPAMLAVDYGYSHFDLDTMLTANKKLIEFWNNGGLVHVNWTAPNPNNFWWAGDTLKKGQSLWDVLDEEKVVSSTWRNELDKLADAFLDLQAHGVPVIFRPMQEMNGWFWYSAESWNPNQIAAFKAIWIDMYEYLTYERGVNNLLWTYSPTYYDPELYHFAGTEYVDIIAPTFYNNDYYYAMSGKGDHAFWNRTWAAFKTTGKVLALGEAGPSTGSNMAQGNFDNMNYLRSFTDYRPETAFITVWSDWYDYVAETGKWVVHNTSIVRNENAYELMNNERSITLGDINLDEFDESEREKTVFEIGKNISVSKATVKASNFAKFEAVDFMEGSNYATLMYSGQKAGKLEIRLDSLDGKIVASENISSNGTVNIHTAFIEGKHDLFLVMDVPINITSINFSKTINTSAKTIDFKTEDKEVVLVYSKNFAYNGKMNMTILKSKFGALNPSIDLDNVADKNGKKFLGFSLDRTNILSLTEICNVAIKGNTTVYMMYESELLECKFTVDGEIFGQAQRVEYGKAPKVAHAVPKKDGYVFKGWSPNDKKYAGVSIVEEVGFYPVTQDMEYVAVFVQDKGYTISFIAMGEKVIPDQKATFYDGKIKNVPTEELNISGYTFLGYSLDGETVIPMESIKNTYAFTDLRFVALFNPVMRKVELLVDGNKIGDGMLIAHNNVIENLIPPEKEGYEFVGWSTNGKKTGIVDMREFVVTADTTLTAIFQKPDKGFNSGMTTGIIIGSCVSVVITSGILILIYFLVINKRKHKI